MLSAAVAAVLELVLAAIVCAGLYGLITLLLRAVPASPRHTEWRRLVALKVRGLLFATFVALAAIVVATNGYFVVRGEDAQGRAAGLVRLISGAFWMALAYGLLKVTLAAVTLLVASRLLRGLLRVVHRTIDRWDQLKDNDRSLAALFGGLERAIVNLAWILLAVYASSLVPAASGVTAGLLLVGRIYLVLSIGLLVIRSTVVIVDTFDALSQKYAQRRDWLQHYDHLRPLLPTFRACLEYALWIAIGALILVQLEPVRGLASWGPRLIQAIAIFFAGRVVIELGHLEIGHRMLPREGLDEMERRRRATMVPLVRSAFTYGTYFATIVLMLGATGFNPMPFLAGAGLLGLVVGFGAQSLINDVVSGFFILFENLYLVGDVVEVGGTTGIVEAIEFRTTKIRDSEGRVHIIRNGDMKPIVNYSKDYIMAVVAVDVEYGADLKAVFSALRYAGERLRAENRDVIGETEIEGITGFGPSVMTVRTCTRVRPGRHASVAAAMRLLIRETFDRQAAHVGRQSLIS
jgi:small conductance mechanosensitive channel